MTPHGPASDVNPPRWAERLLRVLLAPANRDTITGDLLEEYRDAIEPTRGAVRARLWYLRQVLSLALASYSPAQLLIWLAAAGMIVVAFVMRYHLAPPFPDGGWAALAIGASAALFMRRADVGFLSRASVAFGVLFGAVVMTVSVATTLLAPHADQQAVLMPSLAPHWQLLVGGCAAVFMTAGFCGAWRGRRLGTGILAAVATSVAGGTILMGLVTGIARFSPSLLHHIGPASVLAWPVHPANLPNVLMRSVLTSVVVSIVPGVIGAMLGKGLGGLRDRRGRPRLERC